MKGAWLKSALFPSAYYGASSVYQGYISLYYDRLGFSGAQLGLIGAVTALSALAFQPLWGRLGDRLASRRGLLAGLCALSAAALIPAAAGRGFGWQLCAAAGFYAFFCALLPLGDALLISSGDARFGFCRLAGGVSFALAGTLFGLVRARLGAGGAVWVTGGLLLAAAGSALLLPDGPGRGRGSLRPLLADGEVRRMLLFVLVVQAAMAYFYTYYPLHFTSLPGAGDSLLALGCLVSAAAEAPYLLLSGRIYRRFGAEKPMCIAAALMALRWALLGMAGNAGTALASQLLHGGGFIVVSVSMAHWMAERAGKENRASAQALLNMVSFGLARLAGSALGAAAARWLGLRGGFRVSAGLCALAGAWMALRLRKN